MITTLNGKQAIAAAMLAQGMSVVEISQQIDTTRKTIWSWQQDETFQRAVENNQSMLGEVINNTMTENVKELLDKAIPRLIRDAVEIALDTDNDIPTRIRASTLVKSWQTALYPRAATPPPDTTKVDQVNQLLNKYQEN